MKRNLFWYKKNKLPGVCPGPQVMRRSGKSSWLRWFWPQRGTEHLWWQASGGTGERGPGQGLSRAGEFWIREPFLHCALADTGLKACVAGLVLQRGASLPLSGGLNHQCTDTSPGQKITRDRLPCTGAGWGGRRNSGGVGGTFGRRTLFNTTTCQELLEVRGSGILMTCAQQKACGPQRAHFLPQNS